METLQDRLDAITKRKRKVNGKELGKLLVDSLQCQLDRDTPLFNCEQFNISVHKINDEEGRRYYALYRQLYLSLIQLINKAVDLRKQFKISIDSLLLPLNNLLQESTGKEKMLFFPVVYGLPYFNELREKAISTLREDEKYSLETILEFFLDAMDRKICLTIPPDIYQELTRLKGLTGAGSRHEAELHKNLYRLKGGAESDTFDITASDNPFITALKAQAKEDGYKDLEEYGTKIIQPKMLLLLYQGGDAIKRYCKLYTRKDLNKDNNELENTLEELIDQRDDFDYIYSNSTLRELQNALGLYPQVEYVGKSDEFKDNATMLQALRYCISDSKAGKFTLSQALKKEYPELLKLLREYIKKNIDFSGFRLVPNDPDIIGDYLIIALSKTEEENFLSRIKVSGVSTQRDQYTKEIKTRLTPEEAIEGSVIKLYIPQVNINYSEFYITIAFINSYNTLLYLIDKVFSTHLSTFAKLDLFFYERNSEVYNSLIAWIYYRLRYYASEKLQDNRQELKKKYPYLKDDRDFTPTPEAMAEIEDILKNVYKNQNPRGRIDLLEKALLRPLLRSTGVFEDC